MGTDTETKSKLRTGYTTGSCATASSKAGILSIINQKKIETIEILLPKRSRLEIKINSLCSDTILVRKFTDDGNNVAIPTFFNKYQNF